MVIGDKQELRRCLKQLVRRADVCEADLSFDFERGALGVMPMLDCWAPACASPNEALRRACSEQSPLYRDALATFAALDAMDLPTHDLDRAETLQQEYERSAYLRELLDTMRAKCVLLRVPMASAGGAGVDDPRIRPLLCVEHVLFHPGRYGVDYRDAAQRIADAASACGAHNLLYEGFDEQALRYCLLPLCEDERYVLHICLRSADEIRCFSELLVQFSGVRVLVTAMGDVQRCLIDAAAACGQMLVRLSDPSMIGYAISRLGTRFVVYGAGAGQPEIMLGRWINAKEEIWQALAAVYLPLARTGFELQSAALERDVRRIFSENFLALCGKDNA